MPLRLKVLKFRNQPCQDIPEVQVNEAGGSIGRRDGNTLTLPNDASISREHGRVFHDAGAYNYLDCSSNGTKLENHNRVINQEIIVLSDGDRLGIGDYEVLVIIDALHPATDNAPIPGAYAEGQDIPWISMPLSKSAPQPSAPASPVQDLVFIDPPAGSDPFMDLLLGIGNMADERDHEAIPSKKNLVEVTREEGSGPQFHAGRVQHDAPEIAQETGLLSLEQAFQLILKGAGMDFTSLPGAGDRVDAQLEQIGKLLRVFVEGLAKALQARADMKRQMRVAVTTIDANANNPLKFSPGTSQMLELMLGSREQGFKDPVVAVQEGFSDLINHQLAMSAGLQGSLLSVLKRFDPDRIEQSYAEGIVFQKKAKCWEDYCNAYPKLVEGALDDIFGEDFADRYERQLAQLRAAQNK